MASNAVLPSSLASTDGAPSGDCKVDGLTIPDPITGKLVTLKFEFMRVHPCDLIATTSPSKRDGEFDEVAIKASQAFVDYRNITRNKVKPNENQTTSYIRANETYIEATDLFDPELLSVVTESNS